MIFRQVIHEDLGCASYFVGDPEAATAAVIDPRLDVDEYLRLARYLGLRIDHVLETHTHADHVSGGRRLSAATGARIHVHRFATAGQAGERFDDGWELALGRVRLRALHTPGHRPEHTAFALADDRRGPAPWAVLTGDSLLVGGVARPDLAGDGEEGARELFGSLHHTLLRLPDDAEVWPAHLGGSVCGSPGMSAKVASTIGFERVHNPLLGISDEREFVAQATASLPAAPPNFREIVAINGGALELDAVPNGSLTPDEVRLAASEGAILIDIRDADRFDAGHIPGSVSVSAEGPGFATKLARVFGRDRALVIVGGAEDDATRAVRLAVAVGVDGISGVLRGGLARWRLEGHPVARTTRMSVHELHLRRREVQILDVREAEEWADGHLPGSVPVPFHRLHRLPAELDPQRPVAVICASGQRAAAAASLASRLGVRHAIRVVDGGVGTWRDSGWPIESG